MASPLTARLDKLEEKFPAQQEGSRAVSSVFIVQHDEDAGPLLAAQGYNPENGDFAIIRRIVAVSHSCLQVSGRAALR